MELRYDSEQRAICTQMNVVRMIDLRAFIPVLRIAYNAKLFTTRQ